MKNGNLAIAIMVNVSLSIDQLRSRLSQPLPGRQAQLRMAFSRRAEELRLNPDPPSGARIASVSLILYENDLGWNTVMIQRSTHPQDRHSGQVSFPGGKHEESDGTLIQTAKREAQEEIGIDPEKMEILGQLTDLYIPVSNFIVHPFVALLTGQPNFKPQAEEVETILTPSIGHFLQEENKAYRELVVGTGVRLKDVPCYMLEDRAVWGATAMIMSEFLELIS